MADIPSPPKSLFGRLFLLKADEAGVLLWSAGYFFFVLFGYFLIRPVRDQLGIARGAENLPWPMTATMIVMFAVSPLFSTLVSRMPRRRFIPLTHHFVCATLVVFFVALRWGTWVWTGWCFYVWVSVLNLFLVSIFWAFMADCHGPERSPRLFGMIGVGGTLGGLLGSLVNAQLLKGFALPLLGFVQLNPFTMLLACVISWQLAIVFMKGAGRRAVAQPADREQHDSSRTGPFAGMALISRSAYLSLIASYVFIFALTSTFIYLRQGKLIEEFSPDPAVRTAAFAGVSAWTQGATLVVQLFLTGHIIRWLGTGLTLALLPLLTGAGFILLLWHPTLDALIILQVTRGAVHYAVDRPTRETLYSVLSTDAKYKSKSFIDTFVYRGGDFVGTWLPKGVAIIGLPVATVAIAAAIVWSGIAFAVGRMQSRRRGKIDSLSPAPSA